VLVYRSDERLAYCDAIGRHRLMANARTHTRRADDVNRESGTPKAFGAG
jgi:hypothetical protein